MERREFLQKLTAAAVVIPFLPNIAALDYSPRLTSVLRAEEILAAFHLPEGFTWFDLNNRTLIPFYAASGGLPDGYVCYLIHAETKTRFGICCDFQATMTENGFKDDLGKSLSQHQAMLKLDKSLWPS
jgi:hypothetical protein